MTEPTKNKDGQDDLAILYPEREAPIAGRKVVMREYGFLEGLRLSPLTQPIIDAMASLAQGGSVPDLDALALVFAEHADAVVQLIAAACDQPVEWVAGLDDEPGRELLLLWWGVNAHFFGDRVLRALLGRAMKAAAGLTSSSPSAAATSTPNVSAASPAVN